MNISFTKSELDRILATPMENFENSDMLEDAFKCIQKGFSLRDIAQYVGKKYRMSKEDIENLWMCRSGYLELMLLLIAYDGE